MRQAYDEQLAEVTDGLVQLADAVAVAMNRATTSLLDADLDMAESVIAIHWPKTSKSACSN
jgi:phosphate transport system protein